MVDSKQAWFAVATFVGILGASCVSAPVAVAVCVLAAVAWSAYHPLAVPLVLFPFLIPFSNADVTDGAGVTLVRLTTAVAIAGLAVRGSAAVNMLRRVPRYVYWGLGGTLAGYVVSMGLNGFAPGSATAVIGFASRAVQVILVVAAIQAAHTATLVVLSLAAAGISILVAGAYLWLENGTLFAARALFSSDIDVAAGELVLNSTFEFGTVTDIAMLVAYSGVLAVAGAVACVALSRMSRSRIVGGVLLVAAPLVAVSAVFSGRREAILANIAVVTVAALRGSKRMRVGAAVLAMALIGSYLAGPLQTFLEERESISSEFYGGGTGRLALMQASLDVWSDAPLWGHGPNSHAWLMWNRTTLMGHGVAAHNSFTGILVEAGLVGFVPLAAMFFVFGREWWKATSQQADTRSWPSSMFAIVGSVIVAALVSDFINRSGQMIVFAIVCGWVARHARARQVGGVA